MKCVEDAGKYEICDSFWMKQFWKYKSVYEVNIKTFIRELVCLIIYLSDNLHIVQNICNLEQGEQFLKMFFVCLSWFYPVISHR